MFTGGYIEGEKDDMVSVEDTSMFLMAVRWMNVHVGSKNILWHQGKPPSRLVITRNIHTQEWV
jgi:hypothetical protein